MRLLQLARKLGVTQNEILKFLADHDIEMTEKGNAKIDDEYVPLVLNHFQKEELSEAAQATASEDLPIEASAMAAIPEEADAASAIEPPSPMIEQEKEAKTEEVEVIRAKKIKLEGIKVLGKIELPEPPKKKEKEGQSEEIGEMKTGSSSPRSRNSSKDRKKNGRNKYATKPKKTETYEQKLKRQEREAQKRKREREKKIKEKKRKYYERQVKTNIVAAPKKKKVTPKVETDKMPSRPKKKVVKHRNPVIRLWEWLNGKYD